MNISIFGTGYVGAVSSACLAELGHTIVGVDINPVKVDAINEGTAPVVEPGVSERIATNVANGRIRATLDLDEAIDATDLSLVCLGTPSSASGDLSTEALESVTAGIGRAIQKKGRGHTVVIRSTVQPGTTRARLAPILQESAGCELGGDVDLAFNPEFLREGTAVKDFHEPPFILAGSLGDGGIERLREMYDGVDTEFFSTTVEVAESVKFVSNSFHGLKIAFANEVGALLKAAGIDAREAMQIFCEDKQLNISKVYLRPGFAFGGSCLPKELRAFTAFAQSMAVETPMLASVLPSNEKQIQRGFEQIVRHGRGRVALFGLAFKPGTDDLRESPLVILAERLLGRGFELSIYDASLQLGRLTGANREFIEREIPHLDKLLKPTPAECLDGADMIVIGHAPKDAVDTIAAQHEGRPIIDLASVAALEGLGSPAYEGICW